MKIIRVTAVWCPSCLVMRKTWKKWEEEYPNLDIIDYDYDMDEDIVAKYEVGTILPVLIREDNDIETKRLIGEKSMKDLLEFIGEE